jgi:hypothetical protein
MGTDLGKYAKTSRLMGTFECLPLQNINVKS